MKRNWIGKTRHALTLVALVATMTVFGILPAHAGRSQPAPSPPPPSTTDTDSDGLIDTQENGGIPFAGIVAGTKNSYSACIAGETDGTPERNLCLKVNGKEVFVFIKKDLSSLLPLTNTQVDLDILLGPVYRTGSTGLGVAVHRLIPTSSWSPTIRNIPGDTRTNPQKAIFITESLDLTNPETLGNSGVGTPNYGGGDITIFTKRIRDQVTKECTGAYTNCTDMNGATTIDGVVRNWLIHVASHEVAHSLSLRSPLDSTWREHYATATRSNDLHTILEQGMFKQYPTSNTVKFYISLGFTSNEQGNSQFYIP